MDDRRYRQAGYKSGGPPRETPRRPPEAGAGAVLRSRPVSRCAGCGSTLPVTAESLAACPACRAVLHACRQCAHFDPGHRFECTEPVPARIADKHAGNDCPRFALRVTVERETSTGAVRPADARRGFDDLFKK